MSDFFEGMAEIFEVEVSKISSEFELHSGEAAWDSLAIVSTIALADDCFNVMLEGKADIQNETQDLKVVVVPDLNTGTATLLYTFINPVVGLTSFLTQYFLKTPLAKSTTQEFRVQGTWKDPKVNKVDASKEPETKP